MLRAPPRHCRVLLQLRRLSTRRGGVTMGDKGAEEEGERRGKEKGTK